MCNTTQGSWKSSTKINDNTDIWSKVKFPPTDQARADQVSVFLTECVALKGLNHPNLHTLVAACLDNPEQPMVLYPMLQEGNMKKFLLKCRMSEGGSRYVSLPDFLFAYFRDVRVGLAPNWVRLAEPKFTETDLKKSQICPIWVQSDPIWSQPWHHLCIFIHDS